MNRRLVSTINSEDGVAAKAPARWRRRFGALLATLAIVVASLGTSAPAQAWVWSPSVNIVGFASCQTPGFADSAAQGTWLYVYSTGETSYQNVGWSSYWEGHLHTIPSSGSWVAVWVYCNGIGLSNGWHFSRYVWVTRPMLGAAIGPYWFRV
jgi:hypothetical protein